MDLYNHRALSKSADILKKEIASWLEDPDSEMVDATEDALIAFVNAYSSSPPGHLREKILNKISALQKAANQPEVIDLSNPPLLSEQSNWLSWQKAVEHIQPPDHYEGIHLHSLESSEKRELFVAWVKEYIDEEVHHDLLESFVLLEGTCECHITDENGQTKIVRMAPGDFIEMQIGESHDVVITSAEPAKAILQWIKLRA